MAGKPQAAEGYSPEHVERVRATCLFVATVLGDLMDELAVVGGLVPSLLIDQDRLPAGTERHVGTMDLDVGLAVALLKAERYAEVSARLRTAGFKPDKNKQGQPTRQRWMHKDAAGVTVDFLIAPIRPRDKGGTLRNIEKDFAAVITPGLHLAFKDRESVNISGKTILGETAVRAVQVCGPGAFIVLKALAFKGRGEPKDAYDFFYVIRNFGSGAKDVAGRYKRLLKDPDAVEALSVLRKDFQSPDAVGPMRIAMFVAKRPDAAIRADVVALVREFLKACGVKIS